METRSERIVVCLLTYNSERQLARNWSSLIDVVHPIRMIVVDNASRDNTVPMLQDIGVPVHVNKENVGYSAGINQCLNIAMEQPFEWAVLINPDVTPPKDYPYRIVQRLTNVETCGLIGCRLVDTLGHVTHSGGMVSSQPRLVYWSLNYAVTEKWSVVQQEAVTTTRFRHDLGDCQELRQIPWTTFAVAALRRPMLEQVGMLDEAYFLYSSDTELALRAAGAGWETWYEPGVTCVHEGSASVKEAGTEIHLRAIADLQRFSTIEGST